jgi:hypothetical protein
VPNVAKILTESPFCHKINACAVWNAYSKASYRGEGGRGASTPPPDRLSPPPCETGIVMCIKPRNHRNVNNNDSKSIKVVSENAPEAISGSLKCKNFQGNMVCQ